MLSLEFIEDCSPVNYENSSFKFVLDVYKLNINIRNILDSAKPRYETHNCVSILLDFLNHIRHGCFLICSRVNHIHIGLKNNPDSSGFFIETYIKTYTIFDDFQIFDFKEQNKV